MQVIRLPPGNMTLILHTAYQESSVFALPVLHIRSLVYLPCLSDIDNELEIDDLSHV